MLKNFGYTAENFAEAKLAQETAEWTSEPKVLGKGPNHDWQLKAFDKLLPTRQNEIIAPCGSGKSMLQAALAVGDYLASQKTRKQLIIVPQVHIAEGFFPSDGAVAGLSIHGVVHKVQVPVKFNFAQDPSIERLKKWLLAHTTWCETGADISGPIAMASHAALVAVWKSMSTKEREQVVKTTHFRDDESHHTARGSELVVAGEGGNQNQLGAIMRFVYNHDGFCTSTTATGFRGDKKTLRPRTYTVNRYARAFIDHYNGLAIEKFLLEMVIGIDPIDQVVALIKKEPHEKHLVVVPPYNAGWREPYTDKSHGVDLLVGMLVKAGVPRERILNVVPQDEARKEKKNAWLDEPKYFGQKESKYDVIITCRLGREGTDWVPCSRLHVTSNDCSIVLAVQTMGRLLRYFKGKDKIVTRYYRKPILTPRKGLTASEVLDDSKNAILLALQFDEMFLPIRFPVYKEGSAGTGSGSYEETTIAELIGDEENTKLLEKLIALNPCELLSAEEFTPKVEALVKQYAELSSDASDVEWATRILLLRYLRYVSGQFPKVDISFVRDMGFPQFKKLYSALPEGGMLYSFEYSKPNRELLEEIFQIKWEEYVKAGKAFAAPGASKKPSQSVTTVKAKKKA
jgi:hypothetical protein